MQVRAPLAPALPIRVDIRVTYSNSEAAHWEGTTDRLTSRGTSQAGNRDDHYDR